MNSRGRCAGSAFPTSGATSGRSAGEMLAALRARMTNDPETELDVTAHELWRITRLRLEKLLAGA